ncbi:hypothetical protein [Thermococcus peptonophilus]|uniref:Uncharacterized protein n=1 Tax=Thermococcus peptonophilus TaxID=53952 RepID=A0A142CV54_9EURY|nr:hypothetical protein [Thermococcus peptonophilus]AMQ18656.1 hypothetical protein A0127_05475 [Thermococcus peptonophilus]
MIGKRVMGLLVVLMTVASAGCLGGKTTTGTTTETADSIHPGNINSTKTNTDTSTPSSRGKIEEVDLESIVEKIETYSYHQDAVMKLDVTTTEGNITMKTNVSMLITENGYVDIVEKKALVNSTITILPDNLTENMLQIVIGNKTYLKTGFGVNEIEFTTLWDYHPLKIVERVIKDKPLAKYTENGTTVFVYSPSEDVILPLAEAYLSPGDSNVTITDAVLEIRIANGTISQVKLVYSLLVRISSDGPFGHVNVVEAGTWKSIVKITSINERREVRPPTT